MGLWGLFRRRFSFLGLPHGMQVRKAWEDEMVSFLFFSDYINKQKQLHEMRNHIMSAYFNIVSCMI